MIGRSVSDKLNAIELIQRFVLVRLEGCLAHPSTIGHLLKTTATWNPKEMAEESASSLFSLLTSFLSVSLDCIDLRRRSVMPSRLSLNSHSSSSCWHRLVLWSPLCSPKKAAQRQQQVCPFDLQYSAKMKDSSSTTYRYT
jgi:hypothetical protein